MPWVRVLSCSPLFVDPLGVPPGYCGLSIHSTPAEQEAARQSRDLALGPVMDRLNAWYATAGARPIERFFSNWHSPWVNFYAFPADVDYFDERTRLDGRWIRVESCLRELPKPYELPAEFAKLPGGCPPPARRLATFQKGKI